MIVGGLVASAHASMMIVIPVMPRFIELIGGSAFIFGLAFSMQAIGRFLTNIPAGVLSERIGRKWVIIIGGLGVALFATLSGLSDSIPMFLIFRFFSGVASAMTIVVANVVAADPEHRRESRARTRPDARLAAGGGHRKPGARRRDRRSLRHPNAVLRFRHRRADLCPLGNPAPAGDAPRARTAERRPRAPQRLRVRRNLPLARPQLLHRLRTWLLHVLPPRRHVHHPHPHLRRRHPHDGPWTDRPAVHHLVAHAQRPHLPRRSHGGQVRAEDRHHPRGHTRRPHDHRPALSPRRWGSS